jgi:hypothetical protein
MAEESTPTGTLTLSDKSITELKAMAYDLIASGEHIRNNLNIINQEIAKRNQTPKGA